MVLPRRVQRREVSTGPNLGEITAFYGWQEEMMLQKRLKRDRDVVGKPKNVVCSRPKKRVFQDEGSGPLGQRVFVTIRSERYSLGLATQMLLVTLTFLFFVFSCCRCFVLAVL